MDPAGYCGMPLVDALHASTVSITIDPNTSAAAKLIFVALVMLLFLALRAAFSKRR